MKKPRGTIVSLNKAEELASAWHGGQGTALYSFASTTQYFPEIHISYMIEINFAYDEAITNNQRKELLQLKRWFQYKAWEIWYKNTVK
jgi:hypothetical protein